MLEVFKAL